MTAIIKAKALMQDRTVRSFADLALPATSEEPVLFVDPELVRLRADNDRMADILREQEREIARLKKSVDEAARKGEAVGREAGLVEADKRIEALLALLERSIAAALQKFADALASLERLAPLLAADCVDRILGPSAERTRHIADILRKEVSALEAGALIRIDVSAADFTNAEDLRHLAEALRRPDLDIRAIEGLASGACSIKLVLGQLEVGVDQQWGALRAVMLEMAEPHA